MAASSDTHFQLRFFTKEERFAVCDTPFSVPASATISDLSLLINGLLTESDEKRKKVEFDFLISNEFLRESLAKHAELKQLNTEVALDVEYLSRYQTPKPKDSVLHNDWVSSVDANADWILTGCYDNTLQLLSLDGEHKLTCPGHTGPVRAAVWINKSLDDSETLSFISTSHDQTALIWKWNPETNSIECLSACRGHERSVDAVAVSPDTSRFVTGSFDKTLKIWTTDIDEEEMGGEGDDDYTNSKKQKTGSDKSAKTKLPLLTLALHSEGVSGVAWTAENEVCSVSWDHTIRIWDVELGGLKTTLHGTKAFLAVSYAVDRRFLLTASADRHIRLWDPRLAEGSVVQNVFTSHTAWVTCLDWSPNNPNNFISGSLDKILKLWDVRSPRVPLYDLTGHEDQVMCCKWTQHGGGLVLTGSADSNLRIFTDRSSK